MRSVANRPGNNGVSWYRKLLASQKILAENAGVVFTHCTSNKIVLIKGASEVSFNSYVKIINFTL